MTKLKTDCRCKECISHRDKPALRYRISLLLCVLFGVMTLLFWIAAVWMESGQLGSTGGLMLIPTAVTGIMSWLGYESFRDW